MILPQFLKLWKLETTMWLSLKVSTVITLQHRQRFYYDTYLSINVHHVGQIERQFIDKMSQDWLQF